MGIKEDYDWAIQELNELYLNLSNQYPDMMDWDKWYICLSFYLGSWFLSEVIKTY